ncbi:MAG: hypothetical protein V7459_11365 [Oceanicoccus sp.]
MFSMPRKKPRDFVYIDELWEADEDWPCYFLENKIWVFVDEYHPGLIGDEDYSRIIIHADDSSGWLYSRSLQEKQKVHQTLITIRRPVAERQLKRLGFIRWHGSYI